MRLACRGTAGALLWCGGSLALAIALGMVDRYVQTIPQVSGRDQAALHIDTMPE